MTPIRRALGAVAVAWCLCYTVGATAVPVIMLLTGAESLECTCVHGEHALCPMHNSRSGARTCVMDASGDGPVNMTVSASGLSDFVLSSEPSPLPLFVPTKIPSDNLLALSRVPSPDLRPPRS